MVELKDFVRKSLLDIVAGVVAAQQDATLGEHVAKGQIGGMKFPSESGVYYEARLLATTVKFDVAVTVSETTGGDVGAGVAVGVFRANVGGSGAEEREGVSRIQFAVPVMLPKSEDTRKSV